MRTAIILALLVSVSGCHHNPMPNGDPPDTDQAPPSRVDLADAIPVQIWATIYYMKEVDRDQTGGGIPLRNMRDDVIGPPLSRNDWCSAAIEGTVRVDDVAYNYAGTRDPRQADCSHHRPSERVRWVRSRHEYGVGSRNNPLIPFRTIACDLGSVENSTPWVNGGYPAFGQEIYVPKANGVELPDGTIHDGVFTCGDVGGLITGNHIDVFIGAVRGGNSEAQRINPFSFVTSSPGRTVQAYVLR